MSYDLGLYAGESIREPLRTTYYAMFRKLLLAPTQQTLAAICTKPETHEAQGYSYLYNALKAYLITTNHHEKSTADFLAPTLLQHWQKDQQVDEEKQKLAQKNFEFYAEDLAAQNPYPQFANPDQTAVETARDYLKRFKQEDRIYQALSGRSGQRAESRRFQHRLPGIGGNRHQPLPGRSGVYQGRVSDVPKGIGGSRALFQRRRLGSG